MPSLKEILILIFVLFGCLVIFLSSPSQSVNQPSNKLQPDEESSQNENSSLFGDIWKLNSHAFQQVEQTEEINNYSLSEASETSKVKEDNAFDALTQTDYSNNAIDQTTLSLEIVLAEVENLSSDLKLEFENIQAQEESCPICSQSENPSPSICATILAAPGIGACNCATLGCTPEKGTWCVHPCCCVCCAVCCR
ncbi:MAG: hypothetical protein ISS88_00355 [Candidatus Portnoybacteria bacterium]|nr:hypothetical protein [Candidatus Portnoybacteria bacterium]